MSLDQAIKHGKEHRKPYYRSARYDPGCRPHGDCGYCYGNRMHRNLVRIAECEEQVTEFYRGTMSENNCNNCKWIDKTVDENPCSHCHPFTRSNWQPSDPETCEWTYQSCDDYYDTECGKTFQFMTGELSEDDDFKFCPFCGSEIKVKEEEE